jgi:pyridoxamine 5'-phosphate oxidase family protein
MRVFTEAEIAFLTEERLLARIATVGPDGMPHVTPVGWGLSSDQSTIEIGGHNLTATKKFRDVERDGRAAVVIDHVLPPWQPRGIEVRGKAEAIGGERPVIRIHPERVVSWGLEGGGRNARDVR